MQVNVVILKTELFIAKRIMSGGSDKNKLSKPIVIISLTSIILGVAIMLITISVITGFQKGIRDKVIGFGSHVQITKFELNSSMESPPLLIEQNFYSTLKERPEIKNIQVFGYKPAILQTYRDSINFKIGDQESTRSGNEILGVLFKGINKDYDWSFFKDKIIGGRMINFDSTNSEIVISQTIANLMGYKVGDESDAFFIRENSGPKRETFKIVGIYDSGFEDFDKQLILVQLHHIQKLNGWGVQTYLTLADTCINNQFVLRGITSGGTKLYKYDWGNGYQRSDLFPLPQKSTRLKLISTDFELSPLDSRQQNVSVPDTAVVDIKITAPCACTEETLALVNFENSTNIQAPFGSLKIKNGNGTHHLYTGGFEVNLHKWEDLDPMYEYISSELSPELLKTTSIKEMHKDIFSWLDLLDMNILIVIILILIVSLINMITSLLVLILEKTNMIGILKAVGGRNKSIRQIFIFHALFLLTRGLIWGNLLGLGLLAFQYFTGFFKLNAAVYSLDTVPVNFNLLHIFYINAITILVCFIVLIIPSYLVTKINPIKAIRFD